MTTSPKHCSPRELSVIACLHRGMSNKAIAYELGITEATVKVHVRAVMQKIGAKSRVQVILKTITAEALEAAVAANRTAKAVALANDPIAVMQSVQGAAEEG